MSSYYYFFFFILLSIIILSIHALSFRKKNIPVELFVEALKNENEGHFEEALVNYENALIEAKKIRFNGRLKNKIIEKLKLLHTVIEYKKNFIFIR